MTYNLNALFQICANGHEWQTVAALEVGKYQSFDNVRIDRDVYQTSENLPDPIEGMRKVLEAHYEIPVNIEFQITAPPPSIKGLSI